ncbi:MAG: lutA 1 [Bacilli bacterium]|nr:lutA 1 [Bacilli bacterium]
MKVSLFITCLADQFFPNVGISMARLLHRTGVEVDFPAAQTCCGQPAFNSGYVDEARQVAMSMLDAFEDAEYVVSPSGSCSGMVHHYYPELFRDDPVLLKRAEQLIHKTYEFSQFFVDVLGMPELGARFPHRVTYHPSCHATRLLGVKDQPLRLLQQVKDIEWIPLSSAEDCCGFGGTFAVKMSDISGAMVGEKSAHVKETEAEVLVGTDMGCLMNIGGALQKQGHPIRVMHLAELLYEGVMQHV